MFFLSQVQIETIGILVSEKTELQSTVAAKEKLLSEKQGQFISCFPVFWQIQN